MGDSWIKGFREEMFKFQLLLWSFVTSLLFLHSKKTNTLCMTEPEWDSEDFGELLKEWSEEDHRHVHVCYLPREPPSRPNLKIQHYNTSIFKVAALKAECALSLGECSPPLWRNLRGKALLCNASSKMPWTNCLHMHALSHAIHREGPFLGPQDAADSVFTGHTST